jgi:hypothetical protein
VQALMEIRPFGADLDDWWVANLTESGEVSLTSADGTPMEFTCDSIKVRVRQDGKDRVLVKQTPPSRVILTDSRLVVTCNDWAKSGSAIGFGVTAVAGSLLGGWMADSFVKKRRQKSNSFVLQIRHHWIAAVGSESRTGIGGVMRVIVKLPDDDGGGLGLLDIKFGAGSHVAEVAHKTALRVAVHGAAMAYPGSTNWRDEFRELAETEQLPAGKEKLNSYTMPGSLLVGRGKLRTMPDPHGVRQALARGHGMADPDYPERNLIDLHRRLGGTVSELLGQEVPTIMIDAKIRVAESELFPGAFVTTPKAALIIWETSDGIHHQWTKYGSGGASYNTHVLEVPNRVVIWMPFSKELCSSFAHIINHGKGLPHG